MDSQSHASLWISPAMLRFNSRCIRFLFERRCYGEVDCAVLYWMLFSYDWGCNTDWCSVDRPEIFVLCDEPFRFHWISFQALNRLHTNILCNADDDSSKTYDDLNDKWIFYHKYSFLSTWLLCCLSHLPTSASKTIIFL